MATQLTGSLQQFLAGNWERNDEGGNPIQMPTGLTDEQKGEYLGWRGPNTKGRMEYDSGPDGESIPRWNAYGPLNPNEGTWFDDKGNVTSNITQDDSGFLGLDPFFTKMLTTFGTLYAGGQMFPGVGEGGLSGIPDDLGWDFTPGESLTGGDPYANLRGIPNDLGNDFTPNPGNSFGSGGIPSYNSPEGSNFAPVVDRGSIFNPASNSGMPSIANIIAKLSQSGKFGDLFSGNASSMSSGGGMPWNLISGGLSVGSGLLGLLQKKKMQELANRAFDQTAGQSGSLSNQLINPLTNSDPYAAVRALMANPNSITSMPGYQFGQDQGRQAIQRTGAASGSGGNEAIALARYTPEYAQNFYNNEVSRLMNLGQGQAGFDINRANVGANLNANAGNLALGSMKNVNDLISGSLGSIGYGATTMAGAGGAPDYQKLLMKLLTSG